MTAKARSLPRCLKLRPCRQQRLILESPRLDLFTAFLKIGLLGFGGVAPWSRKVMVEERGWLSDEDYAAVLGFGQILLGANTINAAVIIVDRFQGAPASPSLSSPSSSRPWPSWRP